MLLEGKSDGARLQPCCLGASNGGTAVEPQGCRCCRSPAGKSHLTSRRRWDPLGRARPKVLTTPIARQRRTLIRLSCCMRRTVPVVGQGEVMECRDAHLLIGASVTRRIRIVFAFIVVMRPRKWVIEFFVESCLYSALYQKRPGWLVSCTH